MAARILAVKLSSLGDVLHALPAVAEFAAAGARVEWAVQPQFAPLVERFSCVSRVWRIPRPSEPRAWFSAVRALGRESFDLVIDFQGLLKSAIVARAPHAKRVLGPSFAREGSRFFYGELAARPSKTRRHAVDECFDALRHEGIPVPEEAKFPIDFPQIDVDSLAPSVSSLRGPRVAVAPFSRWNSKNWPAERFADAIRILAGRDNARIYVAGGPGDSDAAARIIAAAGVPAANLCGKLSLVESAALFKACGVLVTNDSGPMHLAAAAGARCVALFGPTAPDRTGPWGARHTVLAADPPCPKAPCRKRTCPLGTGACLASISAQTVADAAIAALPY